MCEQASGPTTNYPELKKTFNDTGLLWIGQQPPHTAYSPTINPREGGGNYTKAGGGGGDQGGAQLAMGAATAVEMAVGVPLATGVAMAAARRLSPGRLEATGVLKMVGVGGRRAQRKMAPPAREAARGRLRGRWRWSDYGMSGGDLDSGGGGMTGA